MSKAAAARKKVENGKGAEAKKPDPKKADPKKARGLGRGLAALFGEASAATAAAPPAAAGVEEAEAPVTPGLAAVPRGNRAPQTAPIEHLHPNLEQPRHHYDDAALEALTQSIREQGVLQPLVVRPHPEKQGEYQIVAGERRWRAAQRAQLAELPIVVRSLDDRQTLELAIVENVQREDLTPLEEAEAYHRLATEFGYNDEAIGKAVGKSRSHVANMQRLLALPHPVKQLITEGRLTAGHGRALLGAPNPSQLAREAAERGWSVREIEKRVQQAAERAPGTPRPRGTTAGKSRGKDADTAALEHDLTLALGLKVEIDHETPGGRVLLHYASLEQLDDIIARLRHTPGE